jgi:hypothetical protein
MVDPAQTPNPDQLLIDITELKAVAATIQEQLTAALDRLTHLVDECAIDPCFKFNDWSFSSTSRTTYSYPETVLDIEARLKSAKKAAEADGSATPKVGAPYWTIRSPKP